MRTISPAVGVGPTSSSQHVASKQAHRIPSASKRTSSANVSRRPPYTSAPSSAPAMRRHSSADVGDNSDRNMVSSNSSSRVARRSLRISSANPSRHRDSGPLAGHAGHDVAYLYQQLQDALQQQKRVEEERQLQLVQYRRQLRAYCDENATLRNIIHAGEIRKRDAAIAGADGVPASGLRMHSTGTRQGSSSVTEAELEVLEQRIHLARRRHNRLAHEVRMNSAALAKEEQTRVAVSEEASASLDPASLLMGANRPVYLRMVRLEHALNDVLRKQSTVGVIAQNYRYHLNTLREEATQYDAQQSMLENEYAGRHRDHLQLLELYDTARAAYNVTVEARLSLQRSSAKMRRAKEKALQQKRKEVEKVLADTQRQERRVVDLQQQLEEEAQLLDAAENTKAQLEKQRWNARNAPSLLKTVSTSRDSAENATARGEVQLASDNADERISAFEAAFHGMMQVANVDTLDRLVDVYQAEMDQQCKLQDDLDDLRETRTALQQETHMLRERRKQTKYCAGAGTRFGAGTKSCSPVEHEGLSETTMMTTAAASPLMEREMVTFLREEKEALAAQTSENEHSQSLIREVAERMNLLAALVAEYRPDVRLPAIRISPALSKRSSTLPLYAAVLTQKLLALASDATTAGTASSPFLSTVEGPGSNTKNSNNCGGGGGAIPVVSSIQLVIPANNRRVPLPNERGGHGGADGTSRNGGGRTSFSADVVGISSHAARALLNATSATRPTSSPNGSFGDDNHTGGGIMAAAVAGLREHRRRRSSASAGAGFIEAHNGDDDDDAQLATVAALPPPGGRVLNFDLDTSDDEDNTARRVRSDQSSDVVRFEELIEADEAAVGKGGDNGEEKGNTPAFPHRRRSSGRASYGGDGVGPGRRGRRNSVMLSVAEDDQEDPLRRDEVKKMSAMLQERRKRDIEEAAAAAAQR